MMRELTTTGPTKEEKTGPKKTKQAIPQHKENKITINIEIEISRLSQHTNEQFVCNLLDSDPSCE